MINLFDLYNQHNSWVQFEEIARKDIEYYLNKIKVIKNVEHTVIETTLPIQSPQAIKRSPRTHLLNCPHAELVQFWSATTDADIQYNSPYKDYGPIPKYVTFEPGIPYVFVLIHTFSYCIFIACMLYKMSGVGIIFACKWS